MQSRRRLEARRKMLGRRSSVGSSSVPGKPAKEDVAAGDAVNGMQLRRSTGSQGSSSANQQQQQQEQGMHGPICTHSFFFVVQLQ
jgi:hypothetical protein